MNEKQECLTADERRALREIERNLRREAPHLERSLRVQARGSSPRLMTAAWSVAVVTGLTTLGAGLIATSVALAFLGFVVALVGLYWLSFHPASGRAMSRTARLLRRPVSDHQP